MNETNNSKFDNFLAVVGRIVPYLLDTIVAFVAPLFAPKYLTFWLGISGLGLNTFAVLAVYKLFALNLGVGELNAILSAFSSVGILSVLLVIVITTPKNAVKGMGYLIMSAWLLITFALVALGSMMSSNKALEVPEALVGVGRAVAGLMPAFAIVPIITMTIAFYNNTPFDTASSATGHYFGFVLKMVMMGASIMANVQFGLTRKMPPEVAVLCGMLLEALFLWAYFKLITATAKKDGFDIFVWSAMLILTGTFLAFVGIETVSTLSGLTVPIVARMQEMGALIYVSAIGLSFALTIIAQLTTSLIDWVPSGEQVKGAAKYIVSSAKPVFARLPNQPKPQVAALAAQGPDAVVASEVVEVVGPKL